MLNWRKLALSSDVVLGMMTVAGTVYGSDDVFLNENSHMVVRDLDNATKVTWNSPLYTSNMDALNTKLGEADVRAEIIREAGFTINGSRAMDWHAEKVVVNGTTFDGYLMFKNERMATVATTAMIVVKFNNVNDIQFQVLYKTSGSSDQTEAWYATQGMYVGIQQGNRPETPEEPEAPTPEEPEQGITTLPIKKPVFSGEDPTQLQDPGNINIAGNTVGGTPNKLPADAFQKQDPQPARPPKQKPIQKPGKPVQKPDTQPADALQKPDTQPADALQKPGYGAVPAPSTPDHGQQTIDGNTEGGRPDTGYIAAPSISGEGDSNVTGPDAPTADNQNDANDSNGSNGVTTSPVATPDGAQTDSVTNGTLGFVSAGVNPIARAAVFGNDAAMLYGNNAASSQQTLNPGSSNGNRTRLGGSNTGRDLIHDMIVSDDAKRSNALKMEQAGVGSEWITMVAGAILGFLFAFFRRRKEDERNEENEA